MHANLKDLWGVLALRGVLAILFGLAAVFWPGLTLVTLVYIFSAFIVASGLVTLVMGLISVFSENGSLLGRLLTVVLGAVELAVGVYLLRHVHVAFATIILVIGLVLIARGVIELFVGIFEEETATYKTIFILLGLLTAAVGAIILLQPVAGGVAFVWLLGLYALITGPMLLALAYDVKKLN